MYCGRHLRYLAKVTLSLIVFGFSHTLFALGLSDIEVYSQLGEPFKASVTVLGARDLKGENCIKLAPDSGLQQVTFMLGPVSGDNAKLMLTSNNIVNEPIVNLSLIAGCDSSVERQYVLLLDPPFSYGSLTPNNTAIATLPAEQRVSDNPTSTINSSANQSVIEKPSTSPKKVVKKKNAKRQTPPANRNNEQASNQKAFNSAQTTDANPSNITNNSADNSSSGEPRLSISGGSDNPALNAGLRLDKQLNLTPNAYGPYVPATAEDVLLADEMTVVNNRISHLQNQIDQLQKKNLKLSSDNTLKTTELAQTKSKQNTLTNLLLFIGAILLLILTYFIFAWLRRRQIEKQADYAEALWLSANAEADAQEVEPVEIVKKESRLKEDNKAEVIEEDADDTLPPAPIASAFKSIDDEEEQPIVIEDDQTFSVLDHADVFLFHGRANLAIQLLQNYLIDHPKQSVTIWLFLLDLLEKEKLTDLYEQTATDCKLYYNIKIPEFSQPVTDGIESLEDFPRLAQGLMQVWNTPSALIYLDDLIYNNRLTPRAGLPKNLIEELTLLKAITQDNVNPTDLPPLDSKKLAEIQEKEALLEQIKTERLEAMAEAEKLTLKQNQAEDKETSFEFTLADK